MNVLVGAGFIVALFLAAIAVWILIGLVLYNGARYIGINDDDAGGLALMWPFFSAVLSMFGLILYAVSESIGRWLLETF